MNENDIVVGSVVLSTQGRDKGCYFLVAASDKKGFVYLVDGGVRKLGSPKKKNVKHVSNSGVTLPAIAEKLCLGKKVFDSEVKSALRQLDLN